MKLRTADFHIFPYFIITLMKGFKSKDIKEDEKIQDENFWKMAGSERVKAAFDLTRLARRLAERH